MVVDVEDLVGVLVMVGAAMVAEEEEDIIIIMMTATLVVSYLTALAYTVYWAGKYINYCNS